jgi:hypoxanthine phosphoribosyltransferase
VELLEFSLASFRDESLKLAHMVRESGYEPDCVAYLAKGAWQIGEVCAEYFDASIVELSAHRSGESAKSGARGILQMLPRSVRRKLRETELRKRLKRDNGSVQKKTMRLTDRFALPVGSKRVLLVDDSADTGASLIAARELLEGILPGCEVKTAVVASFGSAREAKAVDFSLHENVLLCSPMSKDNKDYSLAVAVYQEMECGKKVCIDF